MSFQCEVGTICSLACPSFLSFSDYTNLYKYKKLNSIYAASIHEDGSQTPTFPIHPICDFTISLKFPESCLFLIYTIPGLCDVSEIYLHGCLLKLILHTVRCEHLAIAIILRENLVFRHTYLVTHFFLKLSVPWNTTIFPDSGLVPGIPPFSKP